MDDAPAARLQIETLEGRVLRLSGDLDSHTSDDLAEALEAAGPDADVTLDVAGVDFIDSSGLRAVVAGNSALAETGHRLRVRRAGASVRRLVELTGLDDHLDVEAD